ncbi:MAG: hypothetical protein GX879_04730 [Bacteroidales bacterium]|nr:hypothetical protein [Bacteroidales bacterium]
MTTETQKVILRSLFETNRDLFFDKKETEKENKNEINTFSLNSEIVWDSDSKKSKISYYELKEEFKESLIKLSLTEIIQLSDTTHKDNLRKIKNWVKFFGIVLIIQIVIGVIVGLSLLS